MLDNCPALVLNADFRPLSYFPLSIWSWQDAVKAVFLDRVNIVDHYDTYVHSPSFEMRLPSTAASWTLAPSRRAFSANVTSRMAFATEMPMAMIAPMNDCTFSVVRVTRRIRMTPTMTAGTPDTTANASRNDWKFAASRRKITRIASSRPLRRPESVSSKAGTWPRM